MSKTNPSIMSKNLVSVVDPIDAAMMPGGPPVFFAGSDADGFNEENAGALSAGDLTQNVCFVGFGEDCVDFIRQHMPRDSKAGIIYVLESLALVALACERCEAWRGAIVFWAIDSDHGKSAVRKLRAGDAYVRYLLAVLTMLQVWYNFRVVPFYVWTKHNTLLDQVGRRARRHDRDWLRNAQTYARSLSPAMTVNEFSAMLKFFMPGTSVMRTLVLPWDETTDGEFEWPSASPSADLSADLEIPGVHLNVEPLKGLGEVAGGRLKLSRAIGDLGRGPVIMGIANNEKKANLALKLVGPQLVIYRDFYAKEWKQDLRTLDWVGGGPPCVWCSKAGGQSSDDSRSIMIRFGAAEVADHFEADFADWEQPYEAAVLRGGSAIDDLDQSHARCRKPMRRTPLIEGNEKGAEVVDNALLGGGSARLRLCAHMETLDAIELIGEAPRLEHFATAPVCIRDVLVPVGSLDPLTFVNGSFTLLSSPLVTRDRPTVVGFIELRGVALPPGTLVELSCDAESRTLEKCDNPTCDVCMHRWRPHMFEGDSAGLFMLFNRSMPWKRKFCLTQVVRHASFRRPVVSVDGIANAQCASGEPHEGAGKILILDPRFPEHVVRPLHVLESSALLDNTSSSAALIAQCSPRRLARARRRTRHEAA